MCNTKSTIIPILKDYFSDTKIMLYRKNHLNLIFLKRFYNTKLLSSNPPWNICFFGTDEYALINLKSLHENKLFNFTLSQFL